MDELKTEGCWYCGYTNCNDTHKFDDINEAKSPIRSPYIKEYNEKN
tara:strand:+ start:792 stop:929 length:138 start_codon:yes stop_codon:yes gene_type:complete